MTNVVETIASTPWWVFVLFAYLVRLGFAARKPRYIPFRNLFFLPAIFVVISLFGLSELIGFTEKNMGIWIAALLIGSVLGWLHFYFIKIKAVKNEATLYLPGTWSLLIIILALFTSKYFFGFQLAIDPQLLQQEKYLIIWLSLYGLFTGLFFGRAMYAIRCLRRGPYMTNN